MFPLSYSVMKISKMLSYPILTKILDANDWLSVQVHPDDAYGLEHEGELGKIECWYIIPAEPYVQKSFMVTMLNQRRIAPAN